MNPLLELFEKSVINPRTGNCANREDIGGSVATEASRRCRVCKKLFCCAKCRESHQRKKHPNESDDCKLCRLEKLPLERFNSPELLCHLVVRHLPLVCTRCGDIFHTSRDLENVARCDYRALRNSVSSSLAGKPVLQLSGSARTPLERTAFPCTDYDAVRRGYGEIDIHALENFDSPPELARNTSTPMHAGASSRACDIRFKTPVVPACLLKTPRTSTTEQPKTATPVVDGNTSLEHATLDELATTIYNSARSNATNSRDGSESTATFYSILSASRSSIGVGSTPSRSLIAINKRQTEDNGARYSREFYRANPGRMLEAMQEQEEHASVDMELTGVRENLENEANMANVENSHGEAVKTNVNKDSSSKRVRFSDEHTRTNPVDGTIIDPEEYYEAEETASRENAENRVKENRETGRADLNENVVGAASVTASRTARVLMMVVVEGDCERSSADLAPLITTGLRELERRRVPESSEVAAASRRSLQADVTIIKSVETYASTSTVEVYDIPPNASEAPANRSDSTNSSGLFSAVAQVVRYALRGLQGSARDPGSRSNDDAERDRGGTSAIIDGSTTSRPGKRSRESANEPSPASTRLARVRVPGSSDAVHSPLAKRPRARGWYKIKAREPIARMRNASPATTRGVSSETQYFQQGSLSTADAVLPVPSRAHQFTQTE